MAHRNTAQAVTATLVQHTAPGVWPANPFQDLPYLLTESDLARLLKRSVRTLQRRRRSGKAPPFTKHGKQVFYPRDRALAYYAGRAQAA